MRQSQVTRKIFSECCEIATICYAGLARVPTHGAGNDGLESISQRDARITQILFMRVIEVSAVFNSPQPFIE